MTTKLCYECGAEKDEAYFNTTGSTTGQNQRFIKVCTQCETEYDDYQTITQVRAKSNTISHIDAFKNMRSLPSTTGYVYFVKELDRSHVLVGHCMELNAGLNALRLVFYDDLICLLALPGTPQDVSEIKSVFKEYHQHGNWLSYGAKLEKWFIRAKRKSIQDMGVALDLVNCTAKINLY